MNVTTFHYIFSQTLKSLILSNAKTQGNKKGGSTSIKFPMSNLTVLAIWILFIWSRAQISRQKQPAAQHFQFGITNPKQLGFSKTWKHYNSCEFSHYSCRILHVEDEQIIVQTYPPTNLPLSTSISSLETLQDHRKRRSNRIIILRGQIFAGSFSNLVR
jgi:hypothetical protein